MKASWKDGWCCGSQMFQCTLIAVVAKTVLAAAVRVIIIGRNKIGDYGVG